MAARRICESLDLPMMEQASHVVGTVGSWIKEAEEQSRDMQGARSGSGSDAIVYTFSVDSPIGEDVQRLDSLT